MVDAYINHSCTFFDHIGCNQLWDTWNHKHISLPWPGNLRLSLLSDIKGCACTALHALNRILQRWIFLDTPHTEFNHSSMAHSLLLLLEKRGEKKPTKNIPSEFVPWDWFWVNKHTQPVSNLNCYNNSSRH